MKADLKIETRTKALHLGYYNEYLEKGKERLVIEIKPRMRQVFISYSSYNKKFADEVKEQLYEPLKKSDITIWMDAKILGGDDWRTEIEEALKDSDIVLVLFDKNSVKSHYVTYEWAFALGEKGKDSVIPLVVEDCDIHQRIDKNALQRIDFRNDKNWEELVETIKSKLSKQ